MPAFIEYCSYNEADRWTSLRNFDDEHSSIAPSAPHLMMAYCALSGWSIKSAGWMGPGMMLKDDENGIKQLRKRN